jgi:uncharacterized membrane protein YhfC
MQVEDIPTWLSDYWDISLASAQAILSAMVILAVMLPVFYVARGKRAIGIEMVVLFITMSALVGIGWMPFWVLIAAVCVLALAVASIGTDAIVGD